MKKNILFLILLGTTLCTSCDDFLTTPPLDVISEEQWWSTEDQIRMMVDDCYNRIYTASGDHLIPFRDGYTDNAIWRGNTAVADGSFTAYTNKVKDEWKYADIVHLNYVLEGLENSSGIISADLTSRYKAEVRFLRAFLYYDMIFYFGDVPLVTKVLSIDESRETTRQPREEVLSFIIKELEESSADIVKAPSEETGRVNKQVIHAFLSRIHLHEKNYDKVLQHTQEVINSNKYSLFREYDNIPGKNSYEELFRPDADGNNDEVIFEKQYSSPLQVHTLNRGLSYPSSVYKGWLGLNVVQDLVDEYECIAGHPYHDCALHNCEYISKRAEIEAAGGYGEYEYRDPRLKSTLITPGWEWKVNGEVSSVFGIENPNSNDHISKEPFCSGFLVTKWVDLEGEEADRVRGEKNMTIIRYADILMMKAEALIEKNENLQEAVNILNEIRDRAGMPKNIVVTNQETLRRQLRHERRIEFAIEGLRYYDIVRWKISEEVKNKNVYGFAMKNDQGVRENIFMEKRVWKDHMYLWPVPQDARDLNPNLSQNPGW